MEKVKFCSRCNKIHTCSPVDPEKIAREHAKDIAREIDREAVALFMCRSSMVDRLEDK